MPFTRKRMIMRNRLGSDLARFVGARARVLLKTHCGDLRCRRIAISSLVLSWVLLASAANVSSVEQLEEALAGSDAEITLAPGTYEISEEIAVNRAVTITGNTANPASVVITNTIAAAAANGRVFNVTAAGVTLRGLTIAGGKSDAYGGGVLISDGTVENCIVCNNTAYQGGGLAATATKIRACNIFKNTCTCNQNSQGGGGVWLSGATALLYDSAVNSNKAQYAANYAGGGAVYLVSNAIVSNCTVVANYAATSGGAFFGAGYVIDCLVKGNTTGGWGGATRSDDMKFIRCEITGNSGNNSRVCYGGSFYDCYIHHNGSGGAVMHGSAKLYNCTVVDHSGTAIANSGVTCYNCIVWSNKVNYSSGTFYSSCTTPLPNTGSGNTDADPQFKAGYRLPGSSPCVDAGGMDAAYFPESSWRTLDYSRTGPRVYNSIVDLGCYEKSSFDDDDFEVSLERTGLADGTATFSFVILAGDGTYDCKLIYGDGTTNTESVVVSGGHGQTFSRTHTYSGRGVFDVSIVATRNGKTKSFLVTNCVALPYTEVRTFHIDITGTDNQEGTEANPMKSFSRALALAAPGSDFIIAPGAYIVDSEYTLSTGSQISGKTGDPGDVRLYVPSSAAGHRFFTLTAADNLISGVTLDGGSSFDPGGGIVMQAGAIEKCHVINCASHSTTGGGGIYASGAVTITDCVITNNRCALTVNEKGGAGIYFAATGSVVSNCVISFNAAGVSAGGVRGSTTTFLDCVFEGNSATSYGGAGRAIGPFYRCKFLANKAPSGGGAVFGGGPYYDCLFVKNYGNGYGNIEGATLYNCTVVSNSGASAVANGTCYNSIIWGNSSNYSNGKYTSCCTSPLPVGTGNINADPQFNADFSIPGSSPCVDAGDMSAAAFPNSDLRAYELGLDGPRVYNQTVDIGCYEKSKFDPQDFSVGFAKLDYQDRVLTVSLSIMAGDADYDYEVDYGDEKVSGVATVSGGHGRVLGFSHTYSAVGVYDVSCVVTRGTEAQTNVIMFAASIPYAEARTFYVDETGTDNIEGTASNPMKSAERAFMLAAAGSVLRIAPGEYPLVLEHVLEPDVQVIGTTGRPEDVRLYVPSGAVSHRLLTLQTAASSISGVTLDGGTSSEPGGGLVVAGGVVEKCRVINCQSTSTQGGGGICVSGPATITDCVITNNKCLYSANVNGMYGGGGIYVTGGPAVITKCVISYNEAGDNAGGIARNSWSTSVTLTDCVFEGNKVSLYGGAMRSMGAVYRCTFIANRFTRGDGGGGAVFSGGPYYDCLFARNVGGTTQYALIHDAKLYNCTIVSNVSSCVMAASRSDGLCYNSIVWDNVSANGALCNTISGYTCHYCCLPTLPATGTGNITDNPKLTEDYRIGRDSPCIRAGSSSAQAFPNAADRKADLTGVVGVRRVYKAYVDMGCYSAPPRGTILVIR